MHAEVFDELLANMEQTRSVAHSSPSSDLPSMWPTTGEILANHETRLSALEERVRSPMHVVAAAAAASSASSSPPSSLLLGSSASGEPRCPFAACSNRTGFLVNGGRQAPPSHTVKHVKSKKHVEAALSLAGAHRDLLVCACQPPTAPTTLDPQPYLSDVYRAALAPIAKITICTHRACMRLVVANAADLAALRDAVDRAKRGTGRKRAFVNRSDDDADVHVDVDADDDHDDDHGDDELRGDQTVAIEFGAVKFQTPGAVYVLYDAARNQLRVQMERPATNQPFHVAHVARMHRWMTHVIHLSPQHQQMWTTHAAVADAGFVDAFVVVSARVGLGAPAALTESARQALHDGIASGRLVLCAGRSDGWLDLLPRDDVGAAHIALPLAHLHPHTIRMFDANAQPSLPLLSTPTARAVAGAATFDVRMRHFAPKAVAGTELKLEMLCKMSGWHLVAGELVSTDLVAAVDRERANGHERLELLLEMIELEASSQQAADAAAARRRALDAIAEAEALRRENVALKRRLADADKEARERADRENDALREQIARLQVQLLAAKAQPPASPPPASPPVKTAPPPASPPPRRPPPAAAPSAAAAASAAGNVDSWFCEAQTAGDAEREVDRRKCTAVLYLRRGDRQDLRLCVKLLDGKFAHSRISRAADGSFSAVREVAAPTIAALLLQELGLPQE